MEKIKGWVTKQFCGSGDLEIPDAVHIATYLEVTFEQPTLKAIFLAFRARLEALDPAWVFQRQVVIDVVPAAANQGEETTVFYAAPWQVGFHNSDAVKVGFIVSACLNMVCDRLGKGSRFPTLTAIENMHCLGSLFAAVEHGFQLQSLWRTFCFSLFHMVRGPETGQGQPSLPNIGDQPLPVSVPLIYSQTHIEQQTHPGDVQDVPHPPDHQ